MHHQVLVHTKKYHMVFRARSSHNPGHLCQPLLQSNKHSPSVHFDFVPAIVGQLQRSRCWDNNVRLQDFEKHLYLSYKKSMSVFDLRQERCNIFCFFPNIRIVLIYFVNVQFKKHGLAVDALQLFSNTLTRYVGIRHVTRNYIVAGSMNFYLQEIRSISTGFQNIL